jgi:hypothetical protein
MGYGGMQQPYGYGGGMQNPYGGGGYGQQPAWGQGAGGRYSPQLRQAQNQWQQRAGYGGGSPMMGMSGGNMAWNNPQDPGSGYNADAQALRIAQGLPAQESTNAGEQPPEQATLANTAMNQPSPWQNQPWQQYGRPPGNAYGWGQPFGMRQPSMQMWGNGGLGNYGPAQSNYGGMRMPQQQYL